MSQSNAIFISYRRSDSNDVTGRIYDRLSSYFGRDVVFKDVDSIPLGIDFRDHLNQTVGQCQVQIAVIGPTWVQVLEERKTAPVDWVRAEIETALERNIPVIPLLVGGASMPSEADLPDGIKNLASRNGAQARPDPDFHVDMNRLIKALEGIVGSPPMHETVPSDSSASQPSSPALSRVQAIKKTALDRLYLQLEAAYENKTRSSGPDEVKAQQDIDKLLSEIQEIERELNQ